MDAAFKRWAADTMDVDSPAFKKDSTLIYAAWLHGKKTGAELMGVGLPRGTNRLTDVKPKGQP